jgi:hypothetical protein
MTLELILQVERLVKQKEDQVGHTLPKKDFEFLQDTLLRTVDGMAEKFVRGSKEHGGCITDRPALPELVNEMYDGMFYAAAVQRQMKN